MSAASAEESFHVDLQVATHDPELPEGAEWSLWVGTALEIAAAGADRDATLTVRIVGHGESRRLNNAFRHQDSATNVLAFPAPDRNVLLEVDDRELGDLVICLPVVYSEARQQGKQPLAHMAHLVVHGTLHLIGFDHDDDVAARRMEGLETRIMRRLGFPDPYDGS